MCAAVTIVRTRALSRATVGKAMPCANTPSSNSRSDSFIARLPSPAITGVIGLSLRPVLNPRSFRPCLEESRVVPQPLDDLRLLFEHIERREARGRHRRRMRRREQERPRAVVQKIDQRVRSGHVAAERAHRLRQRADLNVHAAVHLEVIDRAAAVLAEHAARMRIVHHHDAAEFLGERRRAPAARRGRRPC